MAQNDNKNIIDRSVDFWKQRRRLIVFVTISFLILYVIGALIDGYPNLQQDYEQGYSNVPPLLAIIFYLPLIFLRLFERLFPFFVVLLLFDIIQNRNNNNVSERIVQQENEARARLEQSPNKIQPAWELGKSQLQGYIQTNVSQIRWIFFYSVTVMIIGFFIIVSAAGYDVIRTQTPSDTNEVEEVTQANVNPTVSIAVVISGVIVEFIGATFLFVYRSSWQHAQFYADKLERMNNIGMAMQILDSISDTEGNETNIIQAKIDIAKQLLKISDDSDINVNMPDQG